MRLNFRVLLFLTTLLFSALPGTCVRAHSLLLASSTVMDPPPNDDLADAIVVDISSGSFSHEVEQASSTEASSETGEVSCNYGRSWWYVFTPVTTGDYRITAEDPVDIFPSPFNQVSLGVYTGTVHPLTEVVCHDNNQGMGRGEAEVLTLYAGTTYYLRVAILQSNFLGTNVTTTVVPVEYSWTGAVSSDWYEAGNWSSGEVPRSTSTVFIDDDAAPTAIIATGSVTVAEMQVISADGFQLNEGASLTISGGNEGLVLDGPSATVLNGDVMISNQTVNYALSVNNDLTVGPNATLTLDGVGVLISLSRMVVSGTVNCTAAPAEGTTFSDGNLEITPSGSFTIDAPNRSGVFIYDGDTDITVNGFFSILDAGVDGIDGGQHDLIVGETGVLEVKNASRNGVSNMKASIDGTLSITGTGGDAIRGDRDFTINDGGTLEVEGVVSSVINFRGGSRLAPGSSPGCTFFQQDLILNDAILAVDIEGTGLCTDYDQLTHAADLSLTDAILELSGTYQPSAGETFIIVKNEETTPSGARFTGLAECDTILYNGVPMLISYIGGDGNDVVLYADPSDAPPVNDDLANAILLAGNDADVTYPASTYRTGATTETSEVDCSGTVSVWYAYTPPATTDYGIRASVTGSQRAKANNDIALSIYSGTTHPLTEIVCLDDNTVQAGGESTSVFLTAGETYYFRLGLRSLAAHDALRLSIEQSVAIWTGATSSNWHDASNWSAGRVPGPGETVFVGGDNAPIAIIDTGSVTVAEIQAGDEGLQLNEGASLTISGGKEGLVLNGPSATVLNGDVTISDQVDNYGLSVKNDLTVGPNATLTLDGVGVYIFSSLMVVSGTVNCTAAPAEGIIFEGADLEIAPSGSFTIDAPNRSGVLIYDGGTDITVNGFFSILDAGSDGINGGQDNLIVGETGVLEVKNASRNGVRNMKASIDGTLSITGTGGDAIQWSQDFTINDGGTLEVEGVVESVINFSGGSRLAPGSSPGCTFFQQELVLNDAILAVEIEGTGLCTDYDQLTNAADLELTDAILELSGSYTPEIGEVFTIVKNEDSAAPTGTFAGLPEGATVAYNGVELEITYQGGGGSDVLLTAIGFILPIDLLSFTGESRDKTNLLIWTTANEEDFSHFEVERSADGVGSWSVLTQSDLQAFGPNRYIYTDQTPLPQAYYRLKMIDLDGTFSYSEVILLENNSGAAAGAMRVYPNPSNGRFTVDLSEHSPSADQPITLSLVDINGREVWKSTISSSNQQATVSIPEPRHGVYLLRLSGASGLIAGQRVVIR